MSRGCRRQNAKHWCFTLNNYTDQDLSRLSRLPEDSNYITYGKEVGASGTPHLQGFVSFQSRKRRSQLAPIIGRAHFSITQSISGSIDYCKKEGDFIELGRRPVERTRNNRNNDSEDQEDRLELFKKSVKEGEYNMKNLREDHSQVCASYPQFVKEYIEDNKPTPKVKFLFYFCEHTRLLL